MTDSKLLKEIIKSSGKTYKHLAESIGITAYSLSMKINNVREFKMREVKILCKELEITSLRKKEKIFFADDVEESSTR